MEAMQQTLDALATELVMRGPASLAPQVVATSVYGIAKAGYSSPRLHHYFDVVQDLLVNNDVGNFSNQHLANIAWSYAFFRRPGEPLMRVVERELHMRNLTMFKNGEISMTLWACAKYKYASDKLYALLANEMSQRGLANCTTQELANLAWALTAGGVDGASDSTGAAGGGLTPKAHPYADVIRAIAQTCVERKLVWKGPNDVRNILSCVVKARTSDGGLSSAVAEELGKRKESGTLRAWVHAITHRHTTHTHARAHTHTRAAMRDPGCLIPAPNALATLCFGDTRYLIPTECLGGVACAGPVLLDVCAPPVHAAGVARRRFPAQDGHRNARVLRRRLHQQSALRRCQIRGCQ